MEFQEWIWSFELIFLLRRISSRKIRAGPLQATCPLRGYFMYLLNLPGAMGGID